MQELGTNHAEVGLDRRGCPDRANVKDEAARDLHVGQAFVGVFHEAFRVGDGRLRRKRAG
jgi:hypothetical protein